MRRWSVAPRHLASRFGPRVQAASPEPFLSLLPTGRIAGGAVSIDRLITVIGSAALSSVGTALTIVLTPSLSAQDGKVAWTCETGDPALHKLVPARVPALMRLNAAAWP
jgi:hypothetical protein